MADALTYGTVIRAITTGELDDALERIVFAVKERKRAVARTLLVTIEPGEKVELTGLRPQYLNGLVGKVTGTRGQRILVTLDNPAEAGRFASRGQLAVPSACIRRVA